jgi:hypothetical protein
MLLQKQAVLAVFAAGILGLFWFGTAYPVHAQCGIGGTVTPPSGNGASGTAGPLSGFLGTNPAGPAQIAGRDSPPGSGENPAANGIVGLFAAALIVGGGGFVLSNERRKQSLAQRGLSGAAQPAERAAALPGLVGLTPQGLEALDAILEDPQQAEEIFLTLVDLDLDHLKALSPTCRKQALEDALAGEIKR